MKVLLITSKPPYPTIDGGCYATARFLDCFIEKDIDTDLFAISTPKHPFNIDSFPAYIRDKVTISSSHINTNTSPWGAIKSLFSSDSYNMSRFNSEQTRKDLLEIVRNNEYTHVVFDSLFSTPYLEAIKSNSNAITFIRTHNVESAIWEQNYRKERNPIKRAFLKGLSSKLKHYEVATLNSTDLILSISKDDTQNFKEIGVQTRIEYMPVGVHCAVSEFNPTPRKAFHIGSMNWKPNIEAVELLIQLWPEVRRNIPEAELHIAGASSDWNPSVTEGIHLDGFIKDIESYAQAHGTMISPIRTGSGVKIKILEMLSFGVPVITSKKGAEGLDSSDMLIIADNNEELLKQILYVMNNPKVMEELSIKGKAYISQHHNQAKIADELLQLLNEH